MVLLLKKLGILLIILVCMQSRLKDIFNKKEKWIGVNLGGAIIYGSSLKEIRHIIDYPGLHKK